MEETAIVRVPKKFIAVGLILVAAIVVYFGIGNTYFTDIDYCLDAGGRWNYDEKRCECSYKEVGSYDRDTEMVERCVSRYTQIETATELFCPSVTKVRSGDYQGFAIWKLFENEDEIDSVASIPISKFHLMRIIDVAGNLQKFQCLYTLDEDKSPNLLRQTTPGSLLSTSRVIHLVPARHLCGTEYPSMDWPDDERRFPPCETGKVYALGGGHWEFERIEGIILYQCHSMDCSVFRNDQALDK